MSSEDKGIDLGDTSISQTTPKIVRNLAEAKREAYNKFNHSNALTLKS